MGEELMQVAHQEAEAELQDFLWSYFSQQRGMRRWGVREERGEDNKGLVGHRYAKKETTSQLSEKIVFI